MKKQTVTAIVLIALASAAALVTYFADRNRTDIISAKPFRPELADFKPDQVAKIRIFFGDKFQLDMVRENEDWIVQANGKTAAFANARLIAETLDDLSRTRIVREIHPSGKEMADLHLADYSPDKKGSGFEMVLSDSNGTPLLNLMLGTPHYKPAVRISRDYAMQEPDGRYVRVTDRNGTKHYCLISRIYEKCLPFSGVWIEPMRISSYDILNWIRYDRVRKDGTDTVWNIARGRKGFELTTPSGQKLDGRQISIVLKLLTGGFTRDVATNGTAFTPDSTISMELVNGITYLIEMQDSPDEMDRRARMKIAFDPKKVVRLQNESDDAYAARLEKIGKHVQLERKWFCKNIYVLQPDVIKIVSQIPQEEKR